MVLEQPVVKDENVLAAVKRYGWSIGRSHYRSIERYCFHTWLRNTCVPWKAAVKFKRDFNVRDLIVLSWAGILPSVPPFFIYLCLFRNSTCLYLSISKYSATCRLTGETTTREITESEFDYSWVFLFWKVLRKIISLFFSSSFFFPTF